MTKEEFLSLPVGIALGVIYDQMPQRMASLPMPARVRPPKFDGRIGRKGGYCWMSEIDVQGLRFWHSKKLEGGDGGGKYAEKDRRDAKALAYWIEWRMAEPTAVWSGERNRQPCTAAPPSAKPTIHPWEPRGDSKPQGESAGASDDDYFGGSSSDETYNF